MAAFTLLVAQQPCPQHAGGAHKTVLTEHQVVIGSWLVQKQVLGNV